jgi:hypothetical protein
MSQPGKISRERLDQILTSMLGDQKLVERWWTTPNRAFDMQSPDQVDIELVRDYIIWHAFCAGG